MEKKVIYREGRLGFKETLHDKLEYEWYLAQIVGLGC